MSPSTVLCVDTCIVVDLFDRYPISVFPALLAKIREDIEEGTLTSIDAVHDELRQGNKHEDKSLKALLNTNLSTFFSAFDQPAADELPNLTPGSRAYRSKRPTKKNADPYLVAWCRAHGATLLTNDKDLIRAAKTDGIATMTFVQYMEARGWAF